MAIDLKFLKPDTSSNWGFRVGGGAEFQQPLVVVKVEENSIAEQAGLKVGDIIVRINEKFTSTLTHSEVQQAISSAGLEFVIGINRGEFVPPEILQDAGKEIEVFMRDVQISVNEEIIDKAEEFVEELGKEIFAEFGQHKLTKTATERSKEKMVFSNSTQTYIPTEEKYKQKKWSTFLMKPDKPTPKLDKTIEERKIEEDPYKIVIKKQSRRKSYPKEKRVQFNQNVLEIETMSDRGPYTPEFPISPEPDSLGSQPEPDSLEEANSENIVEYIEDDNEQEDKSRDNDSEECSEYQCDEIRGSDDENNFDNLRKDSLGIALRFKPISEIIVDPNSETLMTLEEQLRTVQKQLKALSQLPSAVQVTLDAVSKQLAEIVTAEENSDEDGEKEDNGNVDDREATASMEIAEAESGEDSNSIVADDLDEDSIAEGELQSIIERDTLEDEREEEEEQENIEEINRIHEEKLEAERREEELLLKKEKEMEDHKKSTFRPIVLPGGRKWIDPDDVVPTRKPKMTDEKIMESIESSLEVISGKRKGINFMKYTPAPRNLDHLQRSEVYRLIHGTEATSRGIVTRPEKIMPEQDYYNARSGSP